MKLHRNLYSRLLAGSRLTSPVEFGISPGPVSYCNWLVWGLIKLTGSWTNLVGKVFLAIVNFDQLGGPDSRLADWSSRLRQSCH